MSGAYKDILWVEDFDSKNGKAMDFMAFLDRMDEAEDDPSVSTMEDPLVTYKDEVAAYIPERYQFRVHLFVNFYDALKDLMAHVDQYSCAFLDINLEKGFASTSFPSGVQDPFEMIRAHLAEKQICIRPDEDYATFQKNAGYYIYLYLIQSGMPEERIAILTANTGQSADDTGYQNLTGEWETLFESAGMKAPHVIEKRDDPSCLADVQAWLSRVLPPPQEFRSCVMMMSRCLLANLPSAISHPAEGKKKRQVEACGFAYRSKEDYERKAHFLLEGLSTLPIRLLQDEVPKLFYNVIWQVCQPWEACDPVQLEEDAYGHWTTMRTARNWMAHDVIARFDDIAIEAFLFGLSLRGMFQIGELPKEERTSYEQWEDVLLRLLDPTFADRYDESAADKKIQALEQLTMESFHRFNSEKRAGGSGILAFYTNIGALIYNLGAAKKKKACFACDLLRDFLHACVPIQAVQDAKQRNVVHLRIQDNVLDGKQDSRPYYKNYLCGGAAHDAPNRRWAYLSSIVPLIRDELDHNEDA